MHRRDFLAAGLVATFPALPAAAAPTPVASPVVLTITGSIEHTNRDPMDPALDQLMARQEVRFDRAFALDYSSLVGLPSTQIVPTIEYDGRPHELRGPSLFKVLESVGAATGEGTRLSLRALDGYVIGLSLAEARHLDFILATHLDGMPLPLGGLGPLWAVFDPDKIPELAGKPLKERYAQCPWGLYHIDVQGV